MSFFNTIFNPIKPGAEVVIPKGTIVSSMRPDTSDKLSGRAQTVVLSDAWDGYVDTRMSRSTTLCLPMLRWAGSGGYWHSVDLTVDLCHALGVDVPTIPDVREHISRDPGPLSYGNPDSRWHPPLVR